MSSVIADSERSRHRLVTVFIHVTFVVIICILPELLMRYVSGARHRHADLPWWFYAKSAVMIAVFYINYFVIIRHTLLGGKAHWWRFAMWNVALVVGATALLWYINTLGWTPPPRRHRMPDSFMVKLAATTSFMLRDIIMQLLPIVLALALRISDRWTYVERRRRELAAERRANELNTLRNQLNPHFLFNTLNSIYALIEISPAEARQALHELSNLLRYVVYENPALVDVEREIKVIRNYVELMKLRLGERPVTFDIDDRATGTVQVQPLMFVTLVENMFKYGVTSQCDDAMHISLDVDDNRLIFKTENSVEKVPAADNGTKPHAGVGLANLHRGLELLYGSRGQLTIDESDNRFRATITIDHPCKVSDA